MIQVLNRFRDLVHEKLASGQFTKSLITENEIQDIINRMSGVSRGGRIDSVAKTHIKIFSELKEDDKGHVISKQGELLELIEELKNKNSYFLIEETGDLIYYFCKHDILEYTPGMKELYQYIINDFLSKIGVHLDFIRRVIYLKFSIRLLISENDFLSDEERRALGRRGIKNILKDVEKRTIRSFCDKEGIYVEFEKFDVDEIINKLMQIFLQYKTLQPVKKK